MKNPVCQSLGIKYPIIQGPMAWISTSPLVAAVSEAGGLGVLGLLFAPHDVIRKEIQETKKLTDKPFGICVGLFPNEIDPILQIAIEEKVPVMYIAPAMLEMMMPEDKAAEMAKKICDTLHENNIKIISKASHMDDALKAEKAGSDVIVVKGWEGGGHVTDEATMVLVPQAADLIKVPLVASGGIADGRGMAASIVLGASGIEMGTVFMVASETAVHPNMKKAVVKAGDMSTVITGRSTGMGVRQIKNKLSDTILDIEAKYVQAEAAEKLQMIAISSLKKAALEGDTENEGAVMVGQIVPLVKEIRTAKEIIETVMNDCRKILSGPIDLGL